MGAELLTLTLLLAAGFRGFLPARVSATDRLPHTVQPSQLGRLTQER